MSLLDTIDIDFKTALKAKDELKVAVLRMLKAAMKNKEKELRRSLEEGEVVNLVKAQAKQRQDSIEQFTKGGRTELAEREAAELAVLEGYLPRQMSREEIEAAVKNVIEELGAGSMKDMGQVMKAVMAENAGRVDGKVVSEIVKERLSAR